MNIQAGNGYFGKKKEHYKQSVILEVQRLCDEHSNDWLKDDITQRQEQIIQRLDKFFCQR